MGQVKIGNGEWRDISEVELKCHYCDTTSKQDVLTAVWSNEKERTVLICRNHNPFKEGITAIIDALTGLYTIIPRGEQSLDRRKKTGDKK